jgi:hypothetical protein
MPEPIVSPAAWRGAELFQSPDWLHTLTPRENDELGSALDAVNERGLELDSIVPETFRLSALGRLLERIQGSLESGCGAALIRGLASEHCTVEAATRLFWGLARYVGTPVSQSSSGERLLSVRNEGYGVEDPRSRGPNTRKRLSFHTDRCDVIAFLCLKQAKAGGENDVISSVSLYNEMLKRRPDLLDVLLQPFPYKRHTVDTGNVRPYCEQPIFSLHGGHFAANFLRVLIDRADAAPECPTLSKLQHEALDALESTAEDPRLYARFRQEPGDLLFLNNWVTFHRRAAFEDHEEPAERRHLLRLWLAVPNSRPLAPAFAANYGSTAAGALRGGMHPPA